MQILRGKAFAVRVAGRRASLLPAPEISGDIYNIEFRCRSTLRNSIISAFIKESFASWVQIYTGMYHVSEKQTPRRFRKNYSPRSCDE